MSPCHSLIYYFSYFYKLLFNYLELIDIVALSSYEMDKKFSLRTCIPLSSMQVNLYDTYVCKWPSSLLDIFLKLHEQTKKTTLLQKLHIVIKLWIFILILIKMRNKIFRVSRHRVTDVRCNFSCQNLWTSISSVLTSSFKEFKFSPTRRASICWYVFPFVSGIHMSTIRNAKKHDVAKIK